MRDAWLYTKKKDDARELGAALVELGYRPRYVCHPGTSRPPDDGAPLRPPEFAILVSTPGEALATNLLGRMRETCELTEAPLLIALDPEHLRSTPEIALSHEVLVKPFSLEELRLRVARASREVNGGRVDEVVSAGSLEVNLATYVVSVKGLPVQVRRMEFELLKFLITHPSRVFTREALLSRVWGYDYYGGARTVDVHVRRLRAKLGTQASRLRTIRGVGYLFDCAQEPELLPG